MTVRMRQRKPNLKKYLLQNVLLQSLVFFAEDRNLELWISGKAVADMLTGNHVHDILLLVDGDVFETGNELQKVLPDSILESGTHNNCVLTFQLERASKAIDLRGYDKRSGTIQKGVEPVSTELSGVTIPLFTMQVSLAKKSLGRLSDPLDGYSDFTAKTIRLAENTSGPFFENPLVMVQICFYCSLYGFQLDNLVFNKIIACKDQLKDVPRVHCAGFLLKILSTEKPSIGLILLHESGLLSMFFPEASNLAGVEQIQGYNHKDVFYHTCEVVDNISRVTDKLWLRFAALVHDIAKPHTKKFIEGTGWTYHGHEELGARLMKGIFYRLHLDPDKLIYVQKLIRLHLRPSTLAAEGITDSAVRRLMSEAGDDLDDLIILCRSDVTSKNPGKVNRIRKNYDLVESKIREVRQKDELAAFQSPVRGEEIMQICGLKPSKTVGLIKSAIEEAILRDEIPNTREAALQYLNLIKDTYISG